MRKMSLSLLYKCWTWSDKACFCFTDGGMEDCVCVCVVESQGCGVQDEGTQLIQACVCVCAGAHVVAAQQSS